MTMVDVVITIQSTKTEVVSTGKTVKTVTIQTITDQVEESVVDQYVTDMTPVPPTV